MSSPAVRPLLGCLLLALGQCTVCGQDPGVDPNSFRRYQEFCRWSAPERSLFKDVDDGILDRHTLFEACLVVAGHDAPQISGYKQQLTRSISRCKAVANSDEARQTRLRAIFEHLRHEFLHGEYQAELFDVGLTMSSGDFNCLTATVLFQSICQAAAIEVQAVWEPSHVQCWSPISTATGYLVETTAASAATAVSPLIMTNRLESRPLSDRELIAKVFYNRGVQALKDEAYDAALITTWASCLLDPEDTPAKSNLRACLNNWALFASEEGDLELARRLLDEGTGLDPGYEPFARNKALLLAP